MSRGAAPKDVLYSIVIEAIILLENAEFMVDAITSDGAQWNRGMWQLFGVNERKVHCRHVCDDNRKLWFISDFPHLIKCIRNWMTGKNRLFKVDSYLGLQLIPVSDYILRAVSVGLLLK